MSAAEVIERYIDDVVRLLPRRQRDDVAAELRTLLNDDLRARAEQSACSPDEALALTLVRGYGRPNEVAARYQPVWTIIDPADSTSFARAAAIGAGALLVLGVFTDDGARIGILSWLGLLVVVFGAKNWMRRRWPAKGAWKPHDRDRVNRFGTAVLVPIAMCFVVLYAAPTWVLDQISAGRFDTSWATYTTEFRWFRLPFFIGLMVGLLAMLSFAAFQGRWDRLTRRVDIVLNMALAGLVVSLAVRGNIFESSAVDQIARSVLALVALIYVPGVGAQIYRELGRVDRGDTTSEPAWLIRNAGKAKSEPDGLEV